MKTVLVRCKQRWINAAGACAALALALLGAAAHAQVTCSMDGAPDWNLNFGTYSAGSEVTSADSLNFTCTNGGQTARNVKICVGLGVGSGGGSTTNRRMSNGTNAISYQIYRDEGRTQAFRTSTNGAEFVGSVGGGGASVPLPTSIRLYGRITGSPSGFGTYTSTFTSADVSIKYKDYAEGVSVQSCAIIAGSGSGSGSGQTIAYNGSFAASVNVPPSCAINLTGAVIFAARTSLVANTDAAGGVRVTCSSGAPYSIALDDGLHAQGGQRYMQRSVSPANLIEYELYQDEARTTRWGSTASERPPETSGSGSVQFHAIYARVPPQPTPLPGDYTDTVVVTLHY